MLFTRCLNRTICAVCCGSARNRLIARTQQFWRGLACIEASFSNSSTVLQKTPRQSVQDSLLTARSPSIHMFGRSIKPIPGLTAAVWSGIPPNLRGTMWLAA